jgi:hypothetical protein
LISGCRFIEAPEKRRYTTRSPPFVVGSAHFAIHHLQSKEISMSTGDIRWLWLPLIATCALVITLYLTWRAARIKRRRVYLWACAIPVTIILFILFMRHTQSMMLQGLAGHYESIPAPFASAQQALAFFDGSADWDALLPLFLTGAKADPNQPVGWLNRLWSAQKPLLAQLLFVINFATWYWFPFSLLLIVLAAYLRNGDGSRFYSRWVATHRWRWMVSGFVVYAGLLLIGQPAIWSPSAQPANVAGIALLVALLYVTLVLVVLYGAARRQSIFHYLLAGLMLIIWLTLPLLTRNIYLAEPFLRGLIETMRSNVGPWFWMPLTLLLAAYLAFIWRGSRAAETPYRELIAPRKSVWIVFGVVVWVTIIFVTDTLQDVDRHVRSLRIDREFLIDAIRDVNTAATRLEFAATNDPGLTTLRTITENLHRVQLEISTVVTVTQQIVRQLPKQSDNTLGRTGRMFVRQQQEIVAEMTLLSNGLVTRTTQLADEISNNPVWMELQNIDYELCHGSQECESQLKNAPFLASNGCAAGIQLPPIRPLPTRQERLLCRREMLLQRLVLPLAHARFYADDIGDLARALEGTVNVFIFSRKTAFIVVTLLFSLFLLLPWLLYFSFIISKRAAVARNRRALLEDLGLLGRFLDDSVALNNEQQRRVSWLANRLDKLWHTAKPASGEKQSDTTLVGFSVNDGQRLSELTATDHAEVTYPQLLRLKDALQPCQSAGAGGQSELCAPLTLVYQARNEAIESVITLRRFDSREYIIPLIILTLLTGIGWYYTYFPSSIAGLSDLIINGATLEVLSAYLTTSFTAITMTFAGAWLFATTMLMTRWAQDDLLPSSYLYAALRLTIAFLVGLVFAVTSRQALVDNNNAAYAEPSVWLLLTAFAVGAAPFEFVRSVFRVAGQGVQGIRDSIGDWWNAGKFEAPDWGSKHPLTVLEDLTIWDDTRLYQEGVQNVHGLATADLERLVLNVPFSAQQLVDWVDQALLYIHTSEIWRPGFTAIGLRTASDLMDFSEGRSNPCPPAPPQPTAAADPDAEMPSDNLDAVVAAYASGQVATKKILGDTYIELLLDRAVLTSLLEALKNDPNVDHVRKFWQNRRTRPLSTPG